MSKVELIDLVSVNTTSNPFGDILVRVAKQVQILPAPNLNEKRDEMSLTLLFWDIFIVCATSYLQINYGGYWWLLFLAVRLP